MKIRFKLLILFLQISLIPMFFLGFVAYSNSEKAISSQAIARLETIANFQKARIEDLNKQHKETLKDFTSRLQLRVETNNYNQTQSVASQTKLTDILLAAKKSSPSHSNIYIINPTGLVIASTDKEIIGQNKVTDEVFLKGKKHNDISILFKDKRKQVKNYFTGPLFLADKFIGVVVIESDTKSLFALFKDHTGLGTTGKFGLAKHAENGDTLIIVPGRTDKNPNAPLQSTLSKKNINLPLNTAMRGEEKTITDTIDYLGNPVFAVTRYIPELDWGLGVTLNKSEALLPLAKLKSLLIFISVVSAIIIFTLAFFIAQTIAQPLNVLTQLTNDFIRGDFSKRTNIQSNDEIGHLANTFNLMADKLQELQVDQELKVKERTLALDKKVQELENIKKATLNILEDMNETKTKIEQEKAKDDAILASIGDGMIALDDKGIIINVNKKAAELMGRTNNEMVGKKYSDVWNIVDSKGGALAKELRPVSRAMQGEHITTSEYQCVRKDASAFPVALTASPVFIGEQIIGVIEIFRDITREKNIDRMKTEFISLASHQLRTPLSAMKWFLEMLLSGDAGELSKDQKEMVKNVDQSNERMIGLVNSLLNVSRIESGRIIIDPKPTNLGELAQGVIDEVKIKMDEKKQNLIFSVHDKLPSINIDPQLIRQVYMNLLTNAVKYTPKNGDISIFISENDTDIISQVSDTGYGIPKKDHDKVFQKFYRGENIVKVETDGNGLGMYLVKAIIESSNGKIWFESEEGKGTTFWFSMPKSGMIAKAGEVKIS